MSTSKATYHHGDLRAALVHAAHGAARGERRDRAVAARGRPTRRCIAGRALPALRRPRSARLSGRGGRLPRARRAAGGSAPVAVDPRAARRASRSPTCSSRSSGPPCSGSCSASRATATTTSASPRPQRCPYTSARSSSEAFPQADAEALATAIWALVHGLAFLYLDGKLDASTPAVVAERITAAIQALLGVIAL